MLKIVGAVLTIIAVVAIGGLVQLPVRAIRVARGLIRQSAAPARLAAS